MTDALPHCWGCECEVPIEGDTHVDRWDTPGGWTVLEYPCRRVAGTDGGERE